MQLPSDIMAILIASKTREYFSAAKVFKWEFPNHTRRIYKKMKHILSVQEKKNERWK